MQEKTSQALFRYWNEVRGARKAPRRYEIEPSRIAALLAETLIIERPRPEICRFRLAGTRVCEELGRELRGVDFLDLWSHKDARAIDEALESMTRTGATGVFSISGFCGTEGSTVTYELVLMPLTHLDGRIDRFLGSFCPSGGAQWSGHGDIHRLALITHSITWPETAIPEPDILAVPSNEPPPLASFHRKARLVRANRRQFLVYEGGLSDAASTDPTE